MDDDIPVKRRKFDRQNDAVEGVGTKLVSGNLDVSSLSVKPDKIQKLRKIAASCERIQNTKSDDVIISSVGSSPSTSPCPSKLTSLSTPVDPTELKTRLTALVLEEKENEGTPLPTSSSDLEGKHENEEFVHQKTVANDEKNSEGKVLSPSLKDVGETANISLEKDAKLPLQSEEFVVLVKDLINERMKKLEESYIENVIPTLEKKIADLESENKCLEERAVQLQKNLQNVVAEYRKQMQKKPLQNSVAIQVALEPPPLTPLGSGNKISPSPAKPASIAHIVDTMPVLHKPPSILSQVTPKVSSNHFTMQTCASTVASFAQRVATVATGERYPMVTSMATVSQGNMYTTMAGQPRLYREATHKPGSHPNAVVTPRTYTTFARPSGPVTATVYPQPQNHPVSPSNLGVPRNTPQSPRNTPQSPRNTPQSPRNPEQSPPNGFMYPQQISNGATIQNPSHGQLVTNPPQSVPYTANSDRRGHSLPLHSPTLPPRHQMPSGPQITPPDHQASAGRPPPQKPYPAAPGNPLQITALRHYSARPGGPPPNRPVMAPPSGIQNVPRQMIAQNQVPSRLQPPYSRPGGPPPLVRAQPQQQPPPHLQTTSSRFQSPVQTNSMPTRGHDPQNAVRPSAPMAQVPSSPVQTRVQSSAGAPPPRLQSHPLPNTASNGVHVPPLSSPTQSTPSGGGLPRELPPPIPNVSISSVPNGIVLSWNMTIPEGSAQIDSYQLFAYQDNGQTRHSPQSWKKLGIVKALPLPMACTLTQFVSGSVYHFAVRAIDVHGRIGNGSEPCSITLPAENGNSGTS